jgi:hypothetical protein
MSKLFIDLFIYLFLWCWGSNPRPWACPASAPPVSHIPSPVIAFRNSVAGDPWCGSPLTRPWELWSFWWGAHVPHRARKSVRQQDSQISQRPCCEVGNKEKGPFRRLFCSLATCLWSQRSGGIARWGWGRICVDDWPAQVVKDKEYWSHTDLSSNPAVPLTSSGPWLGTSPSWSLLSSSALSSLPHGAVERIKWYNVCRIQLSPLSTGDIFQGPQWMSEPTDSTKP